MNLQQDTCLQPILGHSGSDTTDSVLLTLLKTRSGSAVLDDSVDGIRARTLMFRKNCNGHALSALTAVVHCAFSLVFIHFCDQLTTTWIHLRQLLVCLKRLHILVNCCSDLSSLSKLSWYQASKCKRLALMGPETMTDVYYDVQQWYVDISAVKLTRIVWTDIGTIP